MSAYLGRSAQCPGAALTHEGTDVRFRRHRVLLAGLVAALALAGVAGCSDDGDGDGATRTPGEPSDPADPTTATAPLPPPGGYFQLSEPGTPLPSARQCTARVRRSAWEPRPENEEANRTVPPQPVSLGEFSQFTDEWNEQYRTRITGNFRGTTDEIIQWAACKWGWSDDIVRAEAVRESEWRMHTEGDVEPRSEGVCTFDDTRDPCPTSFGIMQVKWQFHPEVADPRVGSSYPLSKQSTAFNIDLQLAEMRGCYDGMSSYLGDTRGDVWGCLGSWWSGEWHDEGGDRYSGIVQEILDDKPWLDW
jgi:hypothetical protein